MHFIVTRNTQFLAQTKRKIYSSFYGYEEVIHYLEKKVGVVDFTKARGLVNFQSPRALVGPWAFAKSTTPTLFLR